MFFRVTFKVLKFSFSVEKVVINHCLTIKCALFGGSRLISVYSLSIVGSDNVGGYCGTGLRFSTLTGLADVVRFDSVLRTSVRMAFHGLLKNGL